MNFHSVHNPDKIVSFAEAAVRGIAEDGGLFVPAALPVLPGSFFRTLGSLTFPEIAFQVAKTLLAGEIPEGDIRRIIDTSLTFAAPVRPLDETTQVLELFHGPTLAFKDFGARFMARTLAYLHRNAARELTILVATSGDTGTAVAHGFHNVEGMKVVLLYPSGRVSAGQEMQLTTTGGNVVALEVDGTFDECQRLVKQAFADPLLSSRKSMTSANSINVARLLPQTFYYFQAYGGTQGRVPPLVFSIPSGNLGNLTAGLMAQSMGLPVERFIAATNANDVVPRFLHSGVYTPGETIATISNAMDVGDPSNLPRVMHLCGGDIDRVRRLVFSASFSDQETRDAMRAVFERHGYVLDPHGAVAFLALERYRQIFSDKTSHGMILATAHPAKFMEVYDADMRNSIAVPESFRAAMAGTKRSFRLSARFTDLQEFLLTQ